MKHHIQQHAATLLLMHHMGVQERVEGNGTIYAYVNPTEDAVGTTNTASANSQTTDTSSPYIEPTEIYQSPVTASADASQPPDTVIPSSTDMPPVATTPSVPESCVAAGCPPSNIDGH